MVIKEESTKSVIDVDKIFIKENDVERPVKDWLIDLMIIAIFRADAMMAESHFQNLGVII